MSHCVSCVVFTIEFMVLTLPISFWVLLSIVSVSFSELDHLDNVTPFFLSSSLLIIVISWVIDAPVKGCISFSATANVVVLLRCLLGFIVEHRSGLCSFAFSSSSVNHNHFRLSFSCFTIELRFLASRSSFAFVHVRQRFSYSSPQPEDRLCQSHGPIIGCYYLARRGHQYVSLVARHSRSSSSHIVVK